MKKISILFFLLFLVAGIGAGYAQDQQDTVGIYRVQTTDGNEFYGQILFQNENHILLKTEKLGELRILRSDIRLLEPVKGAIKEGGEVWFENPQATRYFWAPNGYGLRAGEGYYQNVWVLFNQASIGLTDNVSFGLGTLPLFLFNGTSTPVWITPKVSFPVVKDKLNLGGGALAGTILGEGKAGFGILYAVSTFGSRDRNLTFGMGYGFAAGSWANAPLFTLSGILRIGRNGYLLTENYYMSVEDVSLMMLSGGGRLMIKRIGLDVGLFLPFSGEEDSFFIALPWLGFSVPLGKGK